MNVTIKTGTRIGDPCSLGRVHTVDVIIGGVTFRTDVDNVQLGRDLALRTARALGMSEARPDCDVYMMSGKGEQPCALDGCRGCGRCAR